MKSESEPPECVSYITSDVPFSTTIILPIITGQSVYGSVNFNETVAKMNIKFSFG